MTRPFHRTICVLTDDIAGELPRPLWRKIPLFPVSVEIVDVAALLSNMSRILQKIFILGIWLVPTTLSWPPYRAIARFTPGNVLPGARDLPISHIYGIKIWAYATGLRGVGAPNMYFCKHKWSSLMIYDLNRFRCNWYVHFLMCRIIGFLAVTQWF